MRALCPTFTSDPDTSIVSTAGELFEDGSLLELLRQEQPSPELSLLLQKGKKRSVASFHLLHTATYVPADLPRSTHLPSRAARYQSTADLCREMVAMLTKFSGCDSDAGRIAVLFALATHFVDCLDLAPCVGVMGEPAHVTNFLRILGCICRHPLLLADLKPAEIWKFPRGLFPTLLTSQSAWSAGAVKALQATQYRGFGTPYRQGVDDPRCAKAIFVNEDTAELFDQLPMVQIYLPPPRSPNFVDDSSLRKIAARFQPMLLQYRLKNYSKVRLSNFDVPQFATATRTLARMFGACVVNDPKLQAEVVELLSAQDTLARGTGWTRLDSLVIEALLVCCHEPGRDSVYVGEVANFINGILSGRGETLGFDARCVGSVLRSFKLFTKRDGRGYRLLLENETRRTVHRLGMTLEVPSLSLSGLQQDGDMPCKFCTELVRKGPVQ